MPKSRKSRSSSRRSRSPKGSKCVYRPSTKRCVKTSRKSMRSSRSSPKRSSAARRSSLMRTISSVARGAGMPNRSRYAYVF